MTISLLCRKSDPTPRSEGDYCFLKHFPPQVCKTQVPSMEQEGIRVDPNLASLRRSQRSNQTRPTHPVHHSPPGKEPDPPQPLPEPEPLPKPVSTDHTFPLEMLFFILLQFTYRWFFTKFFFFK